MVSNPFADHVGLKTALRFLQATATRNHHVLGDSQQEKFSRMAGDNEIRRTQNHYQPVTRSAGVQTGLARNAKVVPQDLALLPCSGI